MKEMEWQRGNISLLLWWFSCSANKDAGIWFDIKAEMSIISELYASGEEMRGSATNNPVSEKRIYFQIMIWPGETLSYCISLNIYL